MNVDTDLAVPVIISGNVSILLAVMNVIVKKPVVSVILLVAEVR